MMSMDDYINKINNKLNNKSLTKNNDIPVKKTADILNTNVKTDERISDSYEKTAKKDTLETEKNQNGKKSFDKKIMAKVSAVAAGVILAGIAFIKRKQIGEFFSNLFYKKNPKTPSAVPQAASPTKPAETAEIKTSPEINFSDIKKDNKTPIHQTSNLQQSFKSIENSESLAKIPEPIFGKNPTLEEKNAYLDSLKPYFVDKNDALIDQAIDAVAKYGTGEDISRIHGTVWMFADDERSRKLIHLVEKIGRKDVDSYQLMEYIGDGKEMDYSLETQIELFKAIPKLFSDFHSKGCKYEYLVNFANRIPEDKTGEYTKEYINMLVKMGNKEDIKELDYYIDWNNMFEENKDATPQCVVDAIEQVKNKLAKKG